MSPMPGAGAHEPPIAGRRVLSLRRHGSRRTRGQAMVEFALIAPAGFLLLLSILVVGIIVTNYIQLTNAARDGARVAAICGSSITAQMPDNSGGCTPTAVAAYITQHLVALPAGTVTPQIYFCTLAQVQSGTCSSSANLCSTLATAAGTTFCQCQHGAILEVDMYYDQPLYMPLISNVFQTQPNGTRRLQATAQATCEQ
jgi:Flp pilus assembly protein TadG